MQKRELYDVAVQQINSHSFPCGENASRPGATGFIHHDSPGRFFYRKGDVMWIIDKDLISNGRDKGRCSVNYCGTVALPHRFSLFDDDGECYYQGRTSDDSSFAPLDDFGKPNAGCTEIRIDGKQL